MSTASATPASVSALSTDGYFSDQLLVNLRPAAAVALGREASDFLRISSADDGVFAELGAGRFEGFDAGDLETAIRPSILSALERAGAIVEAIPARRPRQLDFSVSSQLPIGGGRAVAAAAEAFLGTDGGRASDIMLSGSLVVRVRSPQEIDAVRTAMLQDDGQVASVERIAIRRLQQVVAAEAHQPIAPWHLDRIRLLDARKATRFDNGEGVRVAVLDTGIDATHPLLLPAIDGYSFQAPVPGVTSGERDIIGHGTHVAGTIGAHGVAGDVEGVCRARLHIYKIFDDDVDGTQVYQRADGSLVIVDEHYVNPVMYLRALAACIDNNYDVVNLSIGGPAIGDSREQALFRRLIDQNQIVVAAMGNERRSGSATSWPAAYPGVVAVGALDLNDGVAPFSNGGSHIAVTAPGVDILATMPTYRGVEQWTGRRDANGTIIKDQPLHWTTYRSTMRGTSMASPQIAGAAALWVANNPRSVAGFRQALERSSRRLSLMGGVIPHPDYGFGCIDIDALL